MVVGAEQGVKGMGESRDSRENYLGFPSFRAEEGKTLSGAYSWM